MGPSGNGQKRKLKSRPGFYIIIGIFVAISAFKARTSTALVDEKIQRKDVPDDIKTELNHPNHPNQHDPKKLGSNPTPNSETTQGQLEESPLEDKNVSILPSPSSSPLTPQLEKCRRPAIEQFPRPWMSKKIRANGGVLFYILATAYTFLAVAIICDEFFVPSLEILCDVFKISPDVAGATFMAAGSSAPELATALIGVFVAHDDIGVSGVIGSAVFNIMFVISLCGLLTTQVLYLNWWPLVRDSFFYMVSILALLGTIADEYVEWYESIILLLLYGVYCYVMYNNSLLEAWAHTLPVPFPIHVPQMTGNEEKQLHDERTHVVTYKSVIGSDPDPNSIAAGLEGNDADDIEDNRHNSSIDSGKVMGGPPKHTILALFEPPSQGGWRKYLWKISLPLIYLFYYTVPDCRMEKWKACYIVTFSLAMIWIAIFSYFMIWTITVVGYTFDIPDTVMGLTFVAAGVSVPDALSSLAVLKDGQGDMAVSNAVGSNVFDILVCLGLPWFLSTALFRPGSSIKVYSKGLVYSTLSLLSTVAFLLIATHCNGWRLDKRYGVILMLWYLFFMVFASLYELNVFADFNPKECKGDY